MYTYTHTPTCVHTHTKTYARAHTHTHIHTHTHTHIRAHTHSNAHTCTRTRTYTHLHTHTHMHISRAEMEKQRQDYKEAVEQVESMFSHAKTDFETARQHEKVCMCIYTLDTSSTCKMEWPRLVGSIHHRSLLQNVVSCIGLFCNRDLQFN